MARGHRWLHLYGNINEGQGRAAERLIFAKDERQIAADLGVRDVDRAQGAGTNVDFYIRAGDESEMSAATKRFNSSLESSSME